MKPQDETAGFDPRKVDGKVFARMAQSPFRMRGPEPIVHAWKSAERMDDPRSGCRSHARQQRPPSQYQDDVPQLSLP